MTKKHLIALFVILGAALVMPAQAVPARDPLAPTGRWTAAHLGRSETPPMGWNTYNAFAQAIDEEKIMGNAQALIDTGLARRGYVYVNIDDSWWIGRRQSDQRLQINTALFPSAVTPSGSDFRPYVDRLHRMGLRAGIYSDLGRNSCSQAYGLQSPNLPRGSVAEREVGLYGHVDQDIRTYFVDWGFDYIKVDACGIADYGADRSYVRELGYRPFPPIMFRDQPALSHDHEIRDLYANVAQALARSRPDNDFLFSICNWGKGDVRHWGKDVGNIWRTSDDLYSRWSRMLQSYDSAVTRSLYSHPGAWNDPDMLVIGAGDFDENHLVEARSHFALWAMMDAPLIIGYDLRHAPRSLLDIWGNEDLIAINQDRLGNQAVLAYRSGDIDILVKTLADGRKAVALFNRGLQPFDVKLTAAHLKADEHAPIVLTDVWSKQALPAFSGEMAFHLAPRETRVFIAEAARALPNGLYLSEMTGRINVAEDGVTQPEPDPEMHRVGWGGTQSSGEWPSYPGWGGAQADASPYGTGLSVGHATFRSGIGILSNSRMEIRAGGQFRQFSATLGVDNATRNRTAPVRFFVYGDGRLLAQSGPIAFGETPRAIVANVSGVQIVELVVRSADRTAGPVAVAWSDAALAR